MGFTAWGGRRRRDWPDFYNGELQDLTVNNIPMTSANKLPESIRLTTLDLSFLIPETEDMESVYFPMSVPCCLPLKRPVKVEEFIAALAPLDQRFPQFPLTYKLYSIT